ncbi:hypothetical protein JCM5350_003631 [Sporobolomyces pararoseus]
MVEILKTEDLKRYPWTDRPDDEFFAFYSNLVNVREIHATGFFSRVHQPGPRLYTRVFPKLPRLVTLNTVFPFLSEHPLRFFASFAHLKSLTVTGGHTSLFPVPVEDYPPIEMPFLTELSVSGGGAAHLSVAEFCQLCPKLTSLTLSSERPDYSDILLELPARLTSLSLINSDPDPEQSHNNCDHLISRFTELRHLSLGDCLFSMELPLHLSKHFDKLERLELGLGMVKAKEMCDYIEEAELTLRHLRLDNSRDKAGTRLNVGSGSVIEVQDLPSDDEWFWDDWEMSTIFLLPHPEFTWEKAQEIVALVESQGKVEDGGLYESIATFFYYVWEVNNLAVLRSYRDKDLKHCLETHQTADGLWLRRMDFTTLDPNNLQLV